MANWKELDGELLHLISKRLDNYFDVTRFRSVCVAWRRHSVPCPERHRFRSTVDIPFPNDMILFRGYPSVIPLAKRTVFLIGSPKTDIQTDPSTSWIFKVEDDRKCRLDHLNPLYRCYFHRLPKNFPESLNLSDFRVVELGVEYVFLHAIPFKKIAVLSCLDNTANDFVLLTVHVSGKLVMFESSCQRWTIIEDMPSPYVDVVLHKGNFYAVDTTGRTVLVGLDFETSVVGVPVFGGHKKFLVESKGELLLVDEYWSAKAEEGSSFKVFKLDEVGKEWVKIKNLDDRVLFLGVACNFAASAEDLSVSRGNCIISLSHLFYSRRAKDGSSQRSVRIVVCVFDLEDGSIGPIQKFPQFSKLFGPPPSWIFPTTLDPFSVWRQLLSSLPPSITPQLSSAPLLQVTAPLQQQASSSPVGDGCRGSTSSAAGDSSPEADDGEE